ncbi:MAG TPA: type 1 glutamine amidotransferase [Caulobacteraceae bacterium]
MKVGILQTGDTPARLVGEFGHYGLMFETLLAGRGYEFATFDVPSGAYPRRPEDCDGYIVTGSAAGVYEPDPWIAQLFEFLRAARGRAKLVGICFGHQALAQAFGGNVIKSPKGWGVGLHTYDVAGRQPWMDASPAFRLSASHQDQVVMAPPEAAVIAGSDFCPNGALAYADGAAISCQLHPEFAPAYSTALLESRRSRVPEPLATTAIESLKAPDDHAKFADWMANYLEGRGA